MADDEVQVKVTADTSDFSNKTHQAGGIFEEFSSLLKEHSEGLKSVFEGLLDVEVLKVIGEWEEQFGHLAEQLERTAMMTGMTTDAVQEFNFAVQMSGGNNQAAATTLEHLERSMVAAEDKTSQAALTFKSMGINVLDSAGKLKNVSTVTNEIADYFHGTADGATKTSIAMQLMGRTGASLIPVLDKGTEGLKELSKEFDATGAKLNEEQTFNFGRMDNSIKLLGSSVQGFKLAVATYFEPAAKAIVDAVTWIIEKVTAGINIMNRFTESVSNMGFGKFAPHAGEKEEKPDPTTPKTPKEVEEERKASEAILQMIKDRSDQKQALYVQENAYEEARAAENNSYLLAIGAKSNQEALQQQLIMTQAAYNVEVLHLNAMNEATQEYYEKKKLLAKGNLAEQLKIEEQQKKATDKYNLDITKATDKLTIDQLKTQNKLKEDSLKNYKTLFDGMASSWESVTEQLIRGTTTWGGAFKTVMGDMIIQFAKMAEANVAKGIWADLVSKKSTLATSLLTQNANAVKAATSTYASVSAIPYVGWLLAPEAAAAAYAGVMAFGLPSAAGGWADVPNDGMAMIHKKEMVLPAPLAEKVRNMSDGGGGGGGMEVHIHATDAKSFTDLLRRNPEIIAQAVRDQSRNFNPAAQWKA